LKEEASKAINGNGMASAIWPCFAFIHHFPHLPLLSISASMRKHRLFQFIEKIMSCIESLPQVKIIAFPRGLTSSGEMQILFLEDVFMPDKNQKKAPGQNKKAKKSGEDKDPIDSLLDAGSAYTK
jgi:hypothetical protein